jgi:ribosome-associated protein
MRSLKDRANEDALAEADDRELRSRSDVRTEQKEIEDTMTALAKDLVLLPEKQFKIIELPELVRDKVYDGRRITSGRAFGRQLKLIRKELRSVDWQQIREQLDTMRDPGSRAPVPPRPTSPAEEWATRLVAEGDTALDALAEIAPELDRTALRQLVRSTQKAPAERRKRALQKLMNAVRPLL